MIEKYLNLSEDALFKKIDVIEEKLQKAYMTSIGQEYIDFLENEINIINNIIEEKEFLKNQDDKSGLLMDTYDPEGLFEKTIQQEQEKKKEEETLKRKTTNINKFIKVYKNDD